MKTINYLVLIMAVLVFFSCDEGSDCQTKVLPVKWIESEYADCVDSRYGLQIDLSDDYTIIRSQQEFESRVSGSCNPTLDFSMYDLVIGKKVLPGGNESIDYKLTKDCSKKLKLEVTFNQNATMIAPNIAYHALVPKLGDEETVYVDLIIKNRN